MHFSFSYASETVRAVLQKENLILKALVYQECLRNYIFDDIRMASEVQWKESYYCNEVNIIGEKNSKIFFICTDMIPPEVGELEKLASMVKNIYEYGQGVLICAEFIRNEDDRRRTDGLEENVDRGVFIRLA